MRVAVIADASTDVSWSAATPLPEGRAYASAFAVGGILYIAGGETSGGIVDSILYTGIKPDGSLGFGTDDHWETSERPLPEARSRAAGLYYDGRFFLAGGRTADGATDSIVLARMYQDGQVGQWYESPAALQKALYSPGATVLEGRLYVAGGTSDTSASSALVSFAIGDRGLLSDRQTETELPEALYAPLLFADGDDLVLAGGYGADGAGRAAVYTLRTSKWTKSAEAAAAAEGPSFGRIAGALWYAGQGAGAKAAKVSLGKSAEAPAPAPGSGLLPKNSRLRVAADPDSVLRYNASGSDVSPSDSAFASLKLAADATVSLRSFPATGDPSPTVTARYRVRSAPFITVCDTVRVGAAADTGYTTTTLQEISSLGVVTPLSSAWFCATVSGADDFELSWADSSVDSSYTADVALTLYEVDLYTEALDEDGAAIIALEARTGAQSRRATLQRGKYYVYVSDVDGATGGTFGLSLRLADD